MSERIDILTLPDRRLAYQQQRDSRPETGLPLVFLGGYASSLSGSKASFLAEKCAETDRGLLRFDYRGHGLSSGTFEEGTLGDWLDDALQVFDALTEGPQILVGSSMGGWIALLLAKARPERVAGFVGIAPAPDFTEEIVLPSLTAEQREQLERDGRIMDASDPERPVVITQRFMDEARDHLVLRAPLSVPGPVHVIQGQKDTEVPWSSALKLIGHVTAPSVRLTLVKDGTHSLSRPEDLAFLWEIIQSFSSV